LPAVCPTLSTGAPRRLDRRRRTDPVSQRRWPRGIRRYPRSRRHRRLPGHSTRLARRATAPRRHRATAGPRDVWRPAGSGQGVDRRDRGRATSSDPEHRPRPV